ncbi:hypothetical protein R7D96_21840 [Vibrio sp. Vb2853]|uniref:hypothetical protein n=1 Tax=Vibrio TaxID=662 RepID=UPI001BD4C438|nr:MULTISPECIES: hypothetical protein [Vibrio]ELA6598025.1 hypothetical protein [Vibrio alginolyticus]MBT0071527.1 hypothetical protein [Vibrio alginolyticus]MCA2485793.1 hypothetical protein [Vibrio alginolyticus]MDW1616774.1 hypothetical protein [Vibrio sp. Vb2881]MDW1621479.1 hypothetical protein [Vibrio sp. Vb2864]
MCRKQVILSSWGASDRHVRVITVKVDLGDLEHIRDMLMVVFDNPSNQSGFMRKANYNAPFYSQTPLDYLTDNPDKAMLIAQHIRALAVPW